jgi:DNA-binding response OmpR family regulator
MKVLIIDDNEELAQFMVMSLSEVSVEATTAKNSAEALVKVADEKFDGIIVDATLEQEDGISVAQKLLEHKNGRNVPVLVMSAFSTPLARRMAKSVGCDDLLVKPFGIAQLVERVRNLR